jgi:hypothetical protein
MSVGLAKLPSPEVDFTLGRSVDETLRTLKACKTTFARSRFYTMGARTNQTSGLSSLK